MKKYTLPYFGEIDVSGEAEAYDAEAVLNGKSISLDLNFEQKIEIEVAKLAIVKKILENIKKYDEVNKNYINTDFQDVEGEVNIYIQHHLEELDKEDLSALIDFTDKKVSTEKQLLSKLELVRIGFELEDEDYFITFDYSIDEEITNHLIVINLNSNFELSSIGMES